MEGSPEKGGHLARFSPLKTLNKAKAPAMTLNVLQRF